MRASGRADATAAKRERYARLGNRVWRVPDGRGGFVILKLHRRRRPLPRTIARTLLTALARRKSLPTAEARRVTERAALISWAAAGCDVPALLDPVEVGLAPGPGLLLEYVPGRTLLDLLSPGSELSEDQRGDLLRRFGACWRRRHRLALERGDPMLVQEHGSLSHVIVSGERLVGFDLEQVFRPGLPVLPLITKELLACLRGLARLHDESRLQADLIQLVAGYDDRRLLHEIVAEGTHPASLTRRLVLAADHARERRSGKRGTKRQLLAALSQVLASGDGA